tara:strand:- start:130 stop:612 length:483 start_codon:yes stop_codon:yes gene_type:complete
MSKLVVTFLINCVFCSGINFFWDLGVGISDFAAPTPTQKIDLSTFHRVAGMKKYYDNDYHAAIYHFKQLNGINLENVLYEYVDSYYATAQPMDALIVLDSYTASDLSDNLIYLKSQIYMALEDYNQALITLNYLLTHHNQSEYTSIIRFDIEKINLLFNE